MHLPRFYPILDTATLFRCGFPTVSAAREILEGGARILQIRHKNLFTEALFKNLRVVAQMCRSADARLVVNDRADIATLLGASLHLGQEDLSPSEARRLVGEETPIGFSTHNERQFREALEERCNYVAFGPIFPTSSKDGADPAVGVEQLRRLRSLTEKPLVAIGGITRENAASVFSAGADSVAVIGDLFPDGGSLRGRVEEWIRLCGHPR